MLGSITVENITVHYSTSVIQTVKNTTCVIPYEIIHGIKYIVWKVVVKMH